ncbi:MAG: hypothetical protein IPK19_08120 [Chloroflexi bacterium]|nr:hypothetical protein [Chloroflexota bacterium]
MPSALETLVKILKLEREQGFRDTAVIGGLSAFAQNWQSGAHAQAKRPEHHILVDELIDVIRGYDQMDAEVERPKQVNYMLDRITGRVPAPEAYVQRLGLYATAAPPSDTPGSEAETPEVPRDEAVRPRAVREKNVGHHPSQENVSSVDS